jgi:hypothetical protein
VIEKQPLCVGDRGVILSGCIARVFPCISHFLVETGHLNFACPVNYVGTLSSGTAVGNWTPRSTDIHGITELGDNVRGPLERYPTVLVSRLFRRLERLLLTPYSFTIDYSPTHNRDRLLLPIHINSLIIAGRLMSGVAPHLHTYHNKCTRIAFSSDTSDSMHPHT